MCTTKFPCGESTCKSHDTTHYSVAVTSVDNQTMRTMKKSDRVIQPCLECTPPVGISPIVCNVLSINNTWTCFSTALGFPSCSVSQLGLESIHCALVIRTHELLQMSEFRITISGKNIAVHLTLFTSKRDPGPNFWSQKCQRIFSRMEHSTPVSSSLSREDVDKSLRPYL